MRAFKQVDVFSSRRYGGNPVAVVLEAEGLSSAECQRFATWMNLSETTFIFPPKSAEADYALRIFTNTRELPFAGHPTLGENFMVQCCYYIAAVAIVADAPAA